MEVVILIGPIGAGKTTIGRIVAEKLGVNFYSLDEEEKSYTLSHGYSDDYYETLRREQGLIAADKYRRSFFVEAIKSFLAAHDQGILELGGGHPIALNSTEQETIKKLLEPYKKVIFLMPTENIEEALDILKKRNQLTEPAEDLNTIYFKDKTFWEIAKYIVYTKGRTVHETAKEVLEYIK